MKTRKKNITKDNYNELLKVEPQRYIRLYINYVTTQQL
jgi:hypothetical protein